MKSKRQYAIEVNSGKFKGQVFVGTGSACPSCNKEISESVQTKEKLCLNCNYDPQAGTSIDQPSCRNRYDVPYTRKAIGVNSK